MGWLQQRHALQLFEAALGLARLGGLGAEAVNKALDIDNALLLLLVIGLHLHQPFSALALKGRIVAFVAEQLVMLDMENDLTHTVDKIPVVGNQHQGTGIAFQPLFQPQAGVHIQVVGGLIEQQQVGRAHQRLGQIEANAPAAGKTAHRAQTLLSGKSQSVDQFFGPHPGCVAFHLIKPLV